MARSAAIGTLIDELIVALIQIDKVRIHCISFISHPNFDLDPSHILSDQEAL